MGNTTRTAFGTTTVTVHPHACGEHAYMPLQAGHASGSSPRLWGTHLESAERTPKYRFIPTPVGNTLSKPQAPSVLSVHPHACGEHVPSLKVSQPSYGSSPRLWGTLDITAGITNYERFIPTPVGNTIEYLPSLEVRSVHPHACGEHQYPSLEQ